MKSLPIVRFSIGDKVKAADRQRSLAGADISCLLCNLTTKLTGGALFLRRPVQRLVGPIT